MEEQEDWVEEEEDNDDGADGEGEEKGSIAFQEAAGLRGFVEDREGVSISEDAKG